MSRMEGGREREGGGREEEVGRRRWEEGSKDREGRIKGQVFKFTEDVTAK